VADYPLARCRRVVVAVDPSGASGQDDERADEIGIVVVGRGDDGHAYVLADRSLRDAPAVWGRAAVRAYHEFHADHIVAEENFGGEMVRFVIRAADGNAPVRVISASRGKVLRAEPVSALYEQGLVHHVGRFAVLEDQLCAFTTVGYRGEGSPDHADALVFAVSELMLKDTASILEFYRRQWKRASSGRCRLLCHIFSERMSCANASGSRASRVVAFSSRNAVLRTTIRRSMSGSWNSARPGMKR
jgi:predicted phage terminase large subunit-like protein